MDCPCEESLLRMKLQENGTIARLDFDLAARTLDVIHNGDEAAIAAAIDSLNLGSHLLGTDTERGDELATTTADSDSRQRKALWWVLVINAAFFAIEITTGLLSRSMGLMADSLDMLADALVYGMSLMAVGAAVARKKRVALWSGFLQLLLAALGLAEVVRRFTGAEVTPDFRTMIGISLLALAANAICLWILQRMKSNDAHIRASVIFSANDVIINLGVIAAGGLVWLLDSKLPDLIVGVIVFLIVIRGAMRILKLAK